MSTRPATREALLKWGIRTTTDINLDGMELTIRQLNAKELTEANVDAQPLIAEAGEDQAICACIIVRSAIDKETKELIFKPEDAKTLAIDFAGARLNRLVKDVFGHNGMLPQQAEEEVKN